MSLVGLWAWTRGSAFASNRLGRTDIWLAARNGSNVRQLVAAERSPSGSPRWSPDGRTIAFDSNDQTGARQIWIVDVASGRRRQLTRDSRNVLPSWSHDGKWIYYCSDSAGVRALRKIRPDGSKDTLIDADRGWESFESPDGRYLYYSVSGRGVSLYRLHLATGETAPIPEVGDAGAIRHWAPTDGGLYFVDTRTAPGWIQLATREATKVTPIAKRVGGAGGLAVSPDGRTLLYAQRDQHDSDIFLVYDFE